MPPHARLHLRKQIPLAAGLAGGSADAAAALVACDALWGTGLSRDELAGIAADLGSDVPFLVLGGTALGTGRGEAVSPVLARPTPGTGWWRSPTAACPPRRSTGELDRLRDAGAAGAAARQPDELLAALRQRDPEVLADALGNDLQAAALSPAPGAGRDARRRPRRRRARRDGLRLRPDLRVPGRRRRAHAARGRRPTLRGRAASAGPARAATGPVPGARV